MAPRKRRACLLVVGAVALTTSCTVFNDKTFHPLDATSDGGVSLDGGAGDAGDAASSCGCAGSAAIVCEDFENAPSSIWSALDNAPPPPDTSRAHCGASSLHLHSPALNVGQSYSVGLAETATFSDARLTNGFFARAWVFVPATSTSASGNFASFLQTEQSGASLFGIASQIGATAVAITDWTTDPVAYTQSSDPFPRDTWTCVEWQVTYGVSNGSSQLWIGANTPPVAMLNGVNTQPSPPFDKLNVELYFEPTAAQSAFDAWIDDFEIDATRIGCDR